VSLTVQSTAASAHTAQEDAVDASSAVVAAVSDVDGIAEDDVTTVGVTLSPQFSWDDTARQSNRTGYTFSQELRVKVDLKGNNTEALSQMVDAAVQAGGNALRINSITTDLSPAIKVKTTNEARELAVKDALATAAVLAKVRPPCLTPAQLP
jgi:uncharacterized protein YggE